MGLAERFKKRLEQRDIFSEEPVQAEFVTKTTTEDEIKNTINPVRNILNSEPLPTRYEFEDLEDRVIDKIKRTPYWNEYSIQKQEKMITQFINKKETITNPISGDKKKELINNIMILTNRK